MGLRNGSKFGGRALLDPRDPLLQSERTQGVAADPVYVKGEVFAYVGLPQSLKDLKWRGPHSSFVFRSHLHLVARWACG